MAPLTSDMAFEILAYLTQRPNAQDTFEGILEWWVLERWIERQRVAVHAAVEELVRSGFLEVVRGSDQRERFRLDPQRRTEAEALVARYESRRPEGR